VKAITSYSPYTYATFGPDDPVHVTGTQSLLTLDPAGMTTTVHLDVPSLSIGGIAVQPLVSQITSNTYHAINTEQNFTQRLTRKHLHTHNLLTSDNHYHYTAGSRNVVNRSVHHVIQTEFNQVVRQVVNRITKSIRVVPSYLHTEINHYMPRRTLGWSSVSGKPDFASIYAALGHNHDSSYAALAHNHDASYAALNHNHDASYAALNHNHGTLYYERVDVDNLIGQRASQIWVEGQLLGKAPVAHVHNNYVDSSSLASALSGFPDYNALGMVLQGSETVDNAIMRHVSTTNDCVTLQYYSGGNAVQVQLATCARVEAIYADLQQQVTQGALHMSLHAGDSHP